MQPYVNPYLFSNPLYGNCVPNPMPQPQVQPVGISGKYVNDFNEINASDIPMSGPAIFVKNDRSEIQLREWSPNGQIVPTSYRAVIEQPKQVVPDPQTNIESILDKLDALEAKLDKLSKPSTTKKKETDNAE